MTPISMEDAEARLRAALTVGDAAQIDAAAALVDQLDEPKPVATLHASALWYVSVGIPVFPLIPGAKMTLKSCDPCSDRPDTGPKCPGPEACGHPLCHGFKDATTDPAKVNDWWTADPNRNVGIATGHVFDVVDVDGMEGQQSRAQHWEGVFADIERDCVAKVLTPRPGGMHIYVPPTGDGNSTNIVPKVDYRGIGGYVVAPPSVIAPNGRDHPGTYRFLGEPRFSPALGKAA